MEHLTDQTCLRVADDVTYQSVGEDADTVMLSLRTGTLFTCNTTTRAFLAALDGRRNLAEVVGCLAEQFDVPREKLQADLTAVADRLLDEELIVEA